MRHRTLPYLRRPVQIPRWAIIATAVAGVVVLLSATAWAITPNYNGRRQCRLCTARRQREYQARKRMAATGAPLAAA